VADSELEFSRDYDLPVAIVWDALVDEDLVEGWLAAAHVEPMVGGVYWLDWQSGVRAEPTNGTITGLEQPTAARDGRLEISTDNLGTLEFTLASTPGGSRGSGTLLTLRMIVDTEPRLTASTRAYWLTNLDQLEDLLRGHPVDWTTWQRDRGDAWAEYLRDASATN
jgi:uncharacterized protein YndB with AHSA1/START domain